MKKVQSILTALLMLTAVACSNNTGIIKSEPKNYTAEKLSNIAAYRKENITLPSEMLQIYTFMTYNNSSEYLLLGTGTKTPEFWRTNYDFTEFETVEFPEFDVGKSYDLDISNDGMMTVFLNHADYGDLPPIKNYEYPEDYDEEEYDKAAEYKFMIKTFNINGELISSDDITGYNGIAEKSSMINGVKTDGNILIAGLSGAHEIFNTDGTYIGELTADNGNIDAIGHDRNGSLICTVTYKENETDKLKICYINPDGTLTDFNNTTYDFSETPQEIQQGTGDYILFLYSRSTIFGIRTDNAEIVPLLDINVSGTNSDSIKGFTLMNDGNMALMTNDYKNFSVKFRKYIPRLPEEMEGIPVLKYGVCAGIGEEKYYTEDITEWNDEGHDFMLELKFYPIDYENTSIIFDEIQQDALSGNLPDILETQNGSFGDINLAEKGSLCNLYEFMDNGEIFTRDYFVPNVLECIATGSKLYSLPNRFYINIGTIAKTKFVGDADDWNPDKYVDITINPPIEREIAYDSKWQRQIMIPYTNWIDMETATCHYTDESFIKFLNWCNEADAIEPDYPTLEDYENMSDKERETEYIKQQRQYIDDKEIFSVSHSFGSYENYVIITRGQFDGESITYLDEPKIIPENELAISADSEYKEYAWEYITSRCTDEFYTRGMSDKSFTYPFPITKTGLKYYENFERTNYTDYTKFDETKNDPEWKDYKGIVYQLSFSIYQDCIKCGEITDENVKAVNDVISDLKPQKKYLNLTIDYYNIVDEEFNRFFNGGCTAEECADSIQSRVSIYLSERFG